MIVRYLLAALAAGLLAGILMTPVQYTKAIPLILQAETFEAAGHSHKSAGEAVYAHEDTTAQTGEEPPLLLGRFWNTVFANMVTGAGFALLMAGVSLVSGVDVRFSNGLAWGAAGWLAVQFLPGLGLPPELPGFPYADIYARQYWWMAAVAASGLGMVLLLLRPERWAHLAGILLLIAPHVYGAPRPADISSNVPALLAAEYVMASLAITLFFWLALGLALGFFMEKTGKPA